MRQSLITAAAAAVVSAGLFIGCEKPAETPASTSSGASSSSSSASTTQPSVPEVPKVDAPAVSETPAVPEVKVDASASEAEAKSLLEKVMQYIKDNKLDDAEAGLTKLEAMKDKLPASMQSSIANARKAFDGAKKLQGVKDIGGNLLGK